MLNFSSLCKSTGKQLVAKPRKVTWLILLFSGTAAFLFVHPGFQMFILLFMNEVLLHVSQGSCVLLSMQFLIALLVLEMITSICKWQRETSPCLWTCKNTALANFFFFFPFWNGSPLEKWKWYLVAFSIFFPMIYILSAAQPLEIWGLAELGIARSWWSSCFSDWGILPWRWIQMFPNSVLNYQTVIGVSSNW